MTWNTYSTICIDEGTDLPLPGGVGQVYDLADTGHVTPVALTDLGGVPIASAVAGARGIATFRANTAVSAAIWVSGTTSIAIMSIEGVLDGILSAQTTAQAAQASAASAVDQVAAYIAAGGGGSGAANVVYVVYASGAYPVQPSSYPGVAVRIAIGPTQPTYPAISGITDLYAWADLS